MRYKVSFVVMVIFMVVFNIIPVHANSAAPLYAIVVEIENCIKAVNNDGTYFSEQLTEHLLPEEKPEILETLTPTEKKVLYFISQNKTAKEIGDLLFISNRTVEKHKSHIIRKVKLESKHSSLFLFAKEYESFLTE